MRRTSRYVALLLLAVCALVVAACGSSDDDKGGTTASGGGSGDKVKISFLTHWAPETVRSFERVTAAYEADHPNVDVEIRAVPFADLLDDAALAGRRRQRADDGEHLRPLAARAGARRRAVESARGQRRRGRERVAGEPRQLPPGSTARPTATRTRSTSTRSTSNKALFERPASRRPRERGTS